MDLKLIKFDRSNKGYLAILDLWWKRVEDHNFTDNRPFSQILPTDYGLMVSDSNDTPLCAIFLYPILGAQMAIVGFPIANRDVEKEVRQEALRFLVAGLENEARKLNYEFLFGYSGNQAANGFYERSGFSKGNSGITNYVKRL